MFNGVDLSSCLRAKRYLQCEYGVVLGVSVAKHRRQEFLAKLKEYFHFAKAPKLPSSYEYDDNPAVIAISRSVSRNGVCLKFKLTYSFMKGTESQGTQGQLRNGQE